MISCLRRAGVEVAERHVPVWEGRRAQVRRRGRSRAATGRARSCELLRGAGDDVRRADRRLPGPPRPPAPRAARRAGPVVFNPLVSLCGHARRRPRPLPARKPRRPRRCAAIDRRALPRGRSRRLRHRRRTRSSSGRSGARRVEVCFVGAEERLFQPGWARPTDGEFTALFVGKLIPLHGLETILAAARLAPDLRFRVVGSGQLDRLLDDRPPNVEHVPWVEYEQLPDELHRAVVRARDLRHLGEGGAGDPEQGLPGARLRHAGRHRRHAGRTRAARATAKARCSSRPATREALRRARSAAVDAERSASRRARRLPRARERGRARRALARADRIARCESRTRSLWAAIAAYAAGFASLSILRHRAYTTGRYDLGNMVQTVWNTAHGHFLQMTSGDGVQISRLGRALRPDPRRVRAALVDLAEPGDAARRPGGRRRARRAARSSGSRASTSAASAPALGFALVYLLYPATEWLTLNEFHPVALACPFLLFAFWYLDEDRLRAVRDLRRAGDDDEGGDRARRRRASGIWYAIRRRHAAGAAIAGAGLLVSALAIAVVIPHFNAGAESSFYGRYDAIGGSAGGIVKTAFTHPWTLFEQAFQQPRPPLPAAPARCRSRSCSCSRPLVAGRGPARARAQPALRHAHADLDPLPLHRPARSRR